jgi:hypothetical protein
MKHKCARWQHVVNITNNKNKKNANHGKIMKWYKLWALSKHFTLNLFPLVRKRVTFSLGINLHFTLGRRGLRRGLSCTREQVFECLIRKDKGYTLSKLNIFYTILNLLKHKCLKWSCIFYFKLWAKSYEQKKNPRVFFSPSFSFCHIF